MAIPHIVFKQLAKRRLIGKDGKEKEREIRKLLAEMPGYKTGPYGEIRRWLMEEIQENRQRKHVQAKNFFDVKKEGDAQIVLLGSPNIGKSSLLKKLSSIQIKVANYAFTTLKPIPAIIDFGGALIQIVEIPGLLQGASEGKGGGRAMLAAARNADYLVLMTSVDSPLHTVEAVYKEMEQAQLPFPQFLICNKVDMPGAETKIAELQNKFPDLEVLPISTETDQGMEKLKERLWQNLHLIRVFLKSSSGETEKRPVVVPEGSSVQDVMEELPKNVTKHFRSAKIWGPSAKFDGQEVGEKHMLADGDILEVQ